MAALLPIGLESPSAGSGVTRVLRSIFGSFFFVNPEKIKIKRQASIASARTFAGTVFQPWTNMPDEIQFEGTFYGTRSLWDMQTLSDSINSDPSEKEVNLVYKYRKYPGFVKEISISADADKPRVFTYTFSFVSQEAMVLRRMMLGQLTGLSVEKDFIDSQVTGAIQSVKDGQLNAVVLVADAAWTAEGRSLGLKNLARLALYAAVFSIHFSRNKSILK